MPPFDAAIPPRHALVYLRPDAVWAPVAAQERTLLTAWFAAGRPAVLARSQGDEPAGHWRLGIPLPPRDGKRRLAVTVAPSAVARWRPALLLHDVLASAPARWIEPIETLQAYAQTLHLQPRVYGSFAWQALTGLDYVTAESDIDLVWQPGSRRQTTSLFAALRRWEDASGLKADGEILLPDGAAVCWRELAGKAAPRISTQDASTQVLVKAREGVSLQSRQTLLDAIDADARQDNAPLSLTA